MGKLYKIKFIKDTDLKKEGDVVNTSKKSAESAITAGYAKYVKEPKKKQKISGKDIEKLEKDYDMPKEEMLDAITGLQIEKIVKKTTKQKKIKTGIIVKAQEQDRLIKKYSAITGTINKLIENKCNYFKKQPFEEEYRNVWFPIIADHIEFFNPEGENKRKDIETTKKELRKSYKIIIKILKEWMDLREDYYPLITIWIIGTHFHKYFSSYPYLFLNAMKRSGKTRLLKLIKHLAADGKLQVSMSEAVLFRTAEKHTLCIDELENLGSKEKTNLKDLLNAGYKKGISVERMKKSDSGEFETERFNVFCPISIANIRGVSDVLSDRCITLILERSENSEITRLMEDFEENPKIQEQVSILKGISYTTDTYTLKGIKTQWNNFVKRKEEQEVSNVSSVSSVSSVNLFKMIEKSEIIGRDLELFFYLFMIADLCGGDVLKEIITIAKTIAKEKKEVDREESRDVNLIEFVSQYENKDFVSISKLTTEFKEFIESEEKWITNTWVGKSLRRVQLVKDKSSTGRNRQVKLNIEKAKEKIKIYKEPEELLNEVITEKIG